jgi:hypothetical protein
VGIQITLERRGVQILGRNFQFDGQLEPVGQVLDYLNSEGRSTFPLFDVKILPLLPGGPFKGTTQPEITADNRELGLIYFLDPDYRQQIQVMRNADRVIAYTPHAVLRGNIHRGVETRLRDLFDVLQGAYLAMTDVSIFFTTELPAPFPTRADLLIVNHHYVSFYHSQ